MRKTTFHLVAFIFLLAAVACGPPKSGEASAPGKMDANSLRGAGSTFVYPVMTRWISNYQQNHSGVRINYQSIGSGGGIQQLKKGLVDFGTSDAAIDDNQLKEMNAVVQIPDSAGPVCVTYNLPNLAQPLRLSGDTLAGIYLGTITNWQDAKLKKDNPNVSLPNLPIIVAHRSDGSGTSNIFTTYLSKVSPDWQKKVGQGVSVCWPVGIGGKGSEGVTGVVKQSPGAIGYVELTYAKENNLPVAMVRNEVGDYVAPSPEGTTAAINAYSDQLSQDVRTPIVDPPNTAKDAYPIAGLTFILVAKDGTDPVRRQNIKDFIKDVITNGQDVAQQMNYAKLPDSLQQQDQKLLAEMTANGQPLK